MSRVLGVGAGTFTLGLVWALSIFICLLTRQSVKSKSVVGVAGHERAQLWAHSRVVLRCDRAIASAAGAFAVIVTAIFMAIPLEDDAGSSSGEDEPTDNLVVGRTVLLIFMCIFSVLGLVMLIVVDWAVPIRAQRK
eukprot:m.54195 g.54195  ORF g.54195 m.54195 type:complete len:136 (+) comp6828_c0_seq1:30-437(+)